VVNTQNNRINNHLEKLFLRIFKKYAYICIDMSVYMYMQIDYWKFIQITK